jgi:CheY-like chemotaxis protein
MPPRRLPLVLLVEDDEDSYEVFSEMLASAGYAVSGASDGEQAVSSAKRLLPDLIVMDLELPKVSGYDATRAIKSDPETRDIPILALTGSISGKRHQEAIEAGCDAFLNKPCSLDALLAEVSSRLHSDEGGGAILVVEDDPDLASALADVLRDAGHDVVVKSNGRDALDHLRTHAAPRLILLDLMMPVMDGWQFRAEQRRDPRWAQIPVVAISAVHDVQRNRILAPDAFLQKPLDLGRLIAAVERYMD